MGGGLLLCLLWRLPYSCPVRDLCAVTFVTPHCASLYDTVPYGTVRYVQSMLL